MVSPLGVASMNKISNGKNGTAAKGKRDPKAQALVLTFFKMLQRKCDEH